jgi:predicted GNAT family N-acyltransferase
MSYQLQLGGWDALKSAAQAVRHEVFVVEQKVPLALEWDEMDWLCLHAVVLDEEGTAVATGRLLPDGHIGRMAVRKALRGDQAVLLNAQTHAAPFYARHGFVPEGEEFIEAGIAHICMRHDFG